MARQVHLKGDASTPIAAGKDQAWANLSPGPYIGIVKGNKDPAYMGRLSVLIPSLAKTLTPDQDQLITCEYLSPFYGAKSLAHNDPNSTAYEGSQHSYGLWAVPPDLDTKVLVIFAEGKLNEAFWIGCVQDPYTNHMVPGIASSTSTVDKNTTIAGTPLANGTGVDKVETYGTINVPAGELNRAQTLADPSKKYNATPKPIHPFAEVLLNQGLSTDDVRGNTSSSARRETPSQVFGISTPGRKNQVTTKKTVGTIDSGASDYVDRLSGHTFVMDDGDARGENQLTRLRTASGHQLLMHDTEGVVYIANGSGNAWIEMNKTGRIDVYSGVGGINLRTEGDFNLHSDANINMHAGGQIRMSSSKEIINSAKMLLNLGAEGVLTSSTNGAIRDFANQGISSYTAGQQLHGAAGGTHLAGGQIHFNSVGASNSWGPHWMNTGAVGMTEREEGDVELANKGIKPLEQFSRNTTTTVHRFVTHEPMPRFSGFASDGVVPYQIGDGYDDKMDTKMWSRLSSTPGTTEYTEQRNRISKIESIRLGQYQSDAEKYLKVAMGNSTNATKARELLQKFGKKYDKTFNVINQAGGAFDTAMSISNKIQNFNSKTTLTDVKKNLTTQLTHQVIESFKGNATNLFKDNILVNQAGHIFTVGQSLHGNIGSAGDAINQIKNVKGNLSIANLGSTVNSISTVTNVYNSVMGGNITGMGVAKKIASKFGLYSGAVQNIHGQGFLSQIGSNLGTKIANAGKFMNKAVNSIFGSLFGK